LIPDKMPCSEQFAATTAAAPDQSSQTVPA
jgi:hypothetical protein